MFYTEICLEELRKTIQSFRQDNQSQGQDLNSGPPEYKTGILTTGHSVRGQYLDGC
jgi:hypothetical protein